MTPRDQYQSLMEVIRFRFDTIRHIKSTQIGEFWRAEICAFHGRKIIEGIAFGCIVALKNGVKEIPSDTKGQWKADSIFKSLKSKGLQVFPDPNIFRPATEAEKRNFEVKHTLEGVPEKRMSPDALISFYRHTHKWAHEINPYVNHDRKKFFLQHEEELWEGLNKVEQMMERHTITIKGEMFFCCLKDQIDNQTKVIPLSKIASLMPQ